MELFDKVKAKKQGNSIVVTLPSDLNIEEGTEFYVYTNTSGAITLLPKIEDYFEILAESEFDIGSEIVEH